MVNKVMNQYSYSSYYGRFHQSSISAVRKNLIVFDLAYTSFEPFLVSRLYPHDTIRVDCRKPLIMALKAHFQTDEIASVFTNEKYLFTVCLGNDRVVFPVHRSVLSDSKLHLYATTYFVQDTRVVSEYMRSSIRPAYDNVFFYKKTILFLDCHDLPFPGGCYFDESNPTTYYRILFLTQEPIEHVLNLCTEWSLRSGVMEVPFLSRDVEAIPKFIPFEPISNPLYSDSNQVSAGIVERALSNTRPWLLIHDIILSYYRQGTATDLGIVVEWPFCMTYSGARFREPSLTEPQFVALSINNTRPGRCLQVRRPYERYIEYNHVPMGPWTPIYFYMSTLITSLAGATKVILETVVIGMAYRGVFFCFDRPALEGTPGETFGTEHLLSTLDFADDPNVTVLDRFKHDERYALLRVRLNDVQPDCWCLAASQEPYPRAARLPPLVRQWLDFFREVKEHTFPVDVVLLRLALTLARHNVCFDMKPAEKVEMGFKRGRIQFDLDEKTIQFINEARLVEPTEESSHCVLS